MSIKYMNEAQVMAFFRVVKLSRTPVRDMLLFRLMLTYGMRLHEPLMLKLSDITPDPQHPVEIFITAEKGGLSRHYPISDEISRLLKKWLKERDVMLRGHVDSPYLFISVDPRRGDDHRMQGGTVQKIFERTAARAGLPKDLQHTHVMRHTTAVQLLSKGADLYFVKTWLRHKEISSTMVYCDLMPSGWQRLSQVALQALSF